MNKKNEKQLKLEISSARHNKSEPAAAFETHRQIHRRLYRQTDPQRSRRLASRRRAQQYQCAGSRGRGTEL